MSPRFTHKAVLVTGGGSGIGRATALAFARDGAAVVVAGRSIDALAHTVALIEDLGGRASYVVADVTQTDAVEALVHEVAERHGRLDIAFNNAGIATAGFVGDIDEQAWTHNLAVNLTGVWLSMKHEIAHMRRHGGGVIINMASNIGAHTVIPGMGAYAASKAAVSALTRTAAREYIAEGIRINAVSPGPIDTPMSRRPGETNTERDARISTAIPIGRVGTLDEIAAAVTWLASDEASFAVGHDLVLDGGATA